MEKTLVILKPDAMHKQLAEVIIKELESAGLTVIQKKSMPVTKELAEIHYKEHKDKPFYPFLIDYITGKFHKNEVMAMILEGKNSIQTVRNLSGNTHPEKASPESLRARYGEVDKKLDKVFNVLHSSDSIESANREIRLWFPEKN